MVEALKKRLLNLLKFGKGDIMDVCYKCDIAYEAQDCPMCDLKNKIEDLEDKNESLKDDITMLKDEVTTLEDEISELKDK